MRNRKTQRRLRAMGCKEEKLDFRDKCGIKDPTPYEAVKRIVAAERCKNSKGPVQAVLAVTSDDTADH